MPGVIDFLAEDDQQGGYDFASPDLSSSLMGKRRSLNADGKRAGKQRASDDAGAGEDDEDDEDEAAFISAAINRQNKKSGTDLLKKAVGKRDKGKNKQASGTLSGGGSFQSMGLHPSLLRSLVLRGFNTPTPIQRQAIPAILEQPPRDVVGMARTGSGKTLAYIVPLIQHLNGRHSSTVGVKSIIICPSRELALQILKVGKEIARGWKADEGGEAIRWGLIVGGEGLDEQFALMATNPDVIIATPGRLLHLAVEMNLDLKSVSYVVFDEADRLFEMGFATQLEEILQRLPTQRQTLLFSATLPKSLVEFARAGLQDNPKLVRLDADSKISEDLRMSFFSVKPTEKEAALLILLRDIIGVPFQQEQPEQKPRISDYDKKRKRGAKYGNSASLNGADELLPYQTIIFVATKHHVEYLLLLLTTAGYQCSHIYSSLDQSARGLEMKKFRDAQTSLLIVTDVAARGIDLPVLEHVVNYDFPSSPRVFVHRVGRTARAGKRGFAWNFVCHSELPYLCDLQLFLARPLVTAAAAASRAAKTDDADEALDLHSQLMLGTFAREALDNEVEYVNEGLTNGNAAAAVALPALKQVVERASKMYVRSQSKASQESYRRAKQMVKTGQDQGDASSWALAGSVAEESSIHDVVLRPKAYGLGRRVDPSKSETVNADAYRSMAAARAALLAKVNGFRPAETVFEVGQRGATPSALLMKDRRRVLENKQRAQAVRKSVEEEGGADDDDDEVEVEATPATTGEAEQADEEEILKIFDIGNTAASKTGRKNGKASTGAAKKTPASFRDESIYMDYEQKDAHTERGYSLRQTGDSHFIEQANRATLNLAADDVSQIGTQSQVPNSSRWDMKKKKFVQGNGVGADNKKMIRTESGKLLPASFRSGRFDEWSKEQRVNMQRVGESEDTRTVRTARGLVAKSRGMSDGRGRGGSGRGGSGRGGGGDGEGGAGAREFSNGRRFKHTQMKQMRRPDKLSDDYKKKIGKFKAQNEGQGSSSSPSSSRNAKGRGAAGKRTTGVRRTGAKARSEIKSANQIYKDRALAQKRKDKNARPSRGGGGGGKRRK